MHTKNLIVALLGVAVAVDASVISFNSPVSRTIQRRQNFGGGRFGGNRGGGGGGGGQGQNNNNNNQGQGQGQNQGQDQGQGQNQGQDQAQDQNQGGDQAQDQNQGGDQAQDQNQGGDQAQDQGQNNGGGQGQGQNNGGGANPTCLAPGAVQTGSANDGQGDVVEDGQVASRTDVANFINYCDGETLTNGLQVEGGSCNGIIMGKIPAKNRMVSSIIVNPKHNDELPEGVTFDIQVKINNMQLGFFTNPQETYYSAPQDLNGQGQIIGHTHVTVQDLGNSLDPQQPLDAAIFQFFKGINNGPQGGILSATVTDGLPAGNYRVCTMSGASNHQPVLMPVAQRGTQEDCQKFTVVAGGGGGGQQGGDNNAGQGGQGGGNNGGGGNGQGGGNGGGQGGGNNNNSGSNDNQDNGNQGNANAGGNQNNDNGNGDNDQGQGQGQGQNNGGNGGQQGGGGGDGGATNNAIGGIQAPAVEDSGNANRPFKVGENTFTTKQAAVQRACDGQNNACADAVNRGQLQGSSVTACSAQIPKCVADLS